MFFVCVHKLGTVLSSELAGWLAGYIIVPGIAGCMAMLHHVGQPNILYYTEPEVQKLSVFLQHRPPISKCGPYAMGGSPNYTPE